MLTKFQKSKKLYSVLFLIISALIFLPVIFYVKNYIIQVFAAIILFIHFVLAVIYFVKGISVAAMCTVYYLLLCIGITITLLFAKYIKLPSFFDSNILNTIGIIIPIIFTVVFPLPKMVKEWISDKLDDKDKKVTRDEMIAKSFGIQKRDITGIEYDTFAEYRGIMKYIEATYSISNVPPSLRIIRLIIGGLFLIIGIVGLLIGTNIVDESTRFLYSWTFWVTAFSFILFASGATILVAGFIRGFICIIVLGILGIFGYYVYIILRNALEISILLYCLIVVLSLAIVILSFSLFIKFISRKQRRTLTVYEENDCIYAVDLFLRDACPIINYNYFICVKINFDENVGLQDFDNFNDDLLLYCANRKLVFGGAILNGQMQTYTVYIYFSTQKQEKKIRNYFRRKIKFSTVINIENDPQWNTYKKVLTPSDITLIKIHNQSIINELEEEKFDFTIEVPLIFTAVFEEKENALRFKLIAEQQNYEKVLYDDNSEYAEDNYLAKKYYHHVLVQKTMRISEEWLNIETQKFHQLAKDCGGEYEFLNIGELDENTENDDNDG